MARAIWKGAISFGLVTIPIRVHTAVEEKSFKFNQLHSKDQGRIKYKRTCAVDGEEVPFDEIVKGYEYEKDHYVEIDDEDIKKVAPKTAKVMEILEFVSAEQVDPIYLESSYYVSPDEGGEKPYALLFQALRESKYYALAKVAMHNREHIIVLRPGAKGILSHTMYYQDEIRQVENFGKTDVDIKESELKVAHQLVQALAAEWEPKKYYDTFEANVKELIKAHLEGKHVVGVEKPKKAAPVVDLMDALKQSLAQMEGKKKGPQRAIDYQRENQVRISDEPQPSKKAVRKRKSA